MKDIIEIPTKHRDEKYRFVEMPVLMRWFHYNFELVLCDTKTITNIVMKPWWLRDYAVYSVAARAIVGEGWSWEQAYDEAIQRLESSSPCRIRKAIEERRKDKPWVEAEIMRLLDDEHPATCDCVECENERDERKANHDANT